jgi:hypothetical protein
MYRMSDFELLTEGVSILLPHTSVTISHSDVPHRVHACSSQGRVVGLVPQSFFKPMGPNEGTHKKET